MKRKILILVLSNIRHDARVRRQLFALKDNYQVTIVCFDGELSDEYELISIAPTKLTLIRKTIASLFLITKLYSIAHKILYNYNIITDKLAENHFDLIIANDVETLPIAFSFKNKPQVIFDAHEYAPRHFEDKRMWRIFFQGFNTYLCKQYIPKVADMMTVGKGLALEYEKHFKRKPIVVTNANYYSEISDSQVNSNMIRLVHHGIATPSRRLELMIDLMSLLDDRFTLDLILLTPGFASRGTQNYIQVLQKKASSNSKIKFFPPVKGSEVIQRINEYDLGVFLLPPINFNYENTLPNKLFDFIQARLGIAIGPTPEMAEIVNNYDNGVVSDDFTPQSLASKLNSLTYQDIVRFKKNSAKAAKDLNAEKNATIIRDMVNSVLS